MCKEKKETKKQRVKCKGSEDLGCSSDDESSTSSSTSASSDDITTFKKQLKKLEARLALIDVKSKTFQEGVICPKCGNEGHTKEECKLKDLYCAICITTMNHTTKECHYNGRHATWPQQQSHTDTTTSLNLQAVPPPMNYGHGGGGGGRDIFCYYCRLSGHRKPDCSLW